MKKDPNSYPEIQRFAPFKPKGKEYEGPSIRLQLLSLLSLGKRDEAAQVFLEACKGDASQDTRRKWRKTLGAFLG